MQTNEMNEMIAGQLAAKRGIGPKARGARCDKITIGRSKHGGTAKRKRTRAGSGGLRHTKLLRQREYLRTQLYPAIVRKVRPGSANPPVGLLRRAARIEDRLKAAGLL